MQCFFACHTTLCSKWVTSDHFIKTVIATGYCIAFPLENGLILRHIDFKQWTEYHRSRGWYLVLCVPGTYRPTDTVLGI